jgi:hypothetical protein
VESVEEVEEVEWGKKDTMRGLLKIGVSTSERKSRCISSEKSLERALGWSFVGAIPMQIGLDRRWSLFLKCQ